MDNITHSLVGALLGQAGLKKKTGLAMPALIIGANIPDIDAACFFWLEGVEHLGFRRGITHGPPALVLLPLILARLLYGFDRWQERRGARPQGRLPVSFKWLYLLSFIACLTHPALDWLNVYGIRLLEARCTEGIRSVEAESAEAMHRGFVDAFAGTPVIRARADGMRRNARLVLEQKSAE